MEDFWVGFMWLEKEVEGSGLGDWLINLYR